MDLRDEFIMRVVSGKSFVDVGGLWGTVNEKVSVAALQNARELTMIDVSPPESNLWQLFRDRLASQQVAECTCISDDVCAWAAKAVKHYDVVHCSGVLYHHPNPVLFLESLRRITSRHLIVTSAVTPEEIVNDLGSYRGPPSGAVFVPALDQKEREILWKYWQAAGVGACYGVSEETKWDSHDFAPWWWLFTPRVMLAMATSVGFRVLDDGPIWSGNAHTILLEIA